MFLGVLQLEQSSKQHKEIAELRAPDKPTRKISGNASTLKATSTTFSIITVTFYRLKTLTLASTAIET